MKKLTVIGIILSIMVLPYLNVAQPGGTASNVKSRESNDDSYTYLKTFKIKSKHSVNVSTLSNVDEYAYILSKGVKYTLTSEIQDKAGKLILHLYDRNHKLIATNFLESTNKYYTAINYQCTATGIYYMTFTCKEGKDKCGEGVLKFKN